MKLTSFRFKDRVHLLDMISLGMIDESWLGGLPRRTPAAIARADRQPGLVRLAIRKHGGVITWNVTVPSGGRFDRIGNRHGAAGKKRRVIGGKTERPTAQGAIAADRPRAVG